MILVLFVTDALDRRVQAGRIKSHREKDHITAEDIHNALEQVKVHAL